MKNFISYTLVTFIFISCTREYDCADPPLQSAFIGFSASDIDTFFLRKFKADDNYQNLIDTFIVRPGYSGRYETANDTTTVFITDGKNGIKVDYDWQISIPAVNKIISVSSIVSENKTGKCGAGIFSLDKFGCDCINDVYSAKIDNQIISFSNSNTGRHVIFIRK